MEHEERLKAALADRYRLEREIGAGGMATVYLAQDLKHRRHVAIKVLMPDLAESLGPERFLREIETAANLTHPHILPLHDSGQVDGFLFYVMPFVEGESLRARLNKEKQLPVQDAVQITREIADALAYAHEKGVIHRDVKPANIMLESGHAVLADFGVAQAVAEAREERITRTGTSLGTPAYMSPEQAAGEQGLDGRSDQYGLGCVLYEMLAGHPPFTGVHAEAVIRQHVTEDPPLVTKVRPSVAQEVEVALSRSLAKSPADRFRTTGEMAAAMTPSDGSSQEDTKGLSGPLKIGLGILTVAIFGVVALRVLLPGGGVVPGTGPDGLDPTSGIAVLPFENLSRDPENTGYFVDGVHEEILTELSGLDGVKVINRTSVMAFRNTEKTLREIAAELGVETVLEGSVRTDGNRVRITARLVDASTEEQIWQDRFDRELQDILSVQADVAVQIAEALKGELTSAELDWLRRRDLQTLEAYDLYLRGRHLWNSRTEEGLWGAVEWFEAAIASDPEFAEAHAGLADAYLLLQVYGYLPPSGAVPKARSAARAALELNDQLAEAHNALALILWYADRDWEEAERRYLRAIELNPNYSTAHSWYAELLVAAGRTAEGIPRMLQARELDPASPAIAAFTGRRLYYARQYETALQHILASIELDPTYDFSRVWEALALCQMGRPDEALAGFQKQMASAQPTPIMPAVLAYLYASAGQKADALQIVGELEGEARRSQLVPYWVAMAYVGLGDRNRAFEWLERAFEVRDGWILSLNVDPTLDPLRDDPRFSDLVRRVGLAP